LFIIFSGSISRTAESQQEAEAGRRPDWRHRVFKADAALVLNGGGGAARLFKQSNQCRATRQGKAVSGMFRMISCSALEM
jgi:hypothetical protein